MKNQTPKITRFQKILKHLSNLPPAHSALQAYKMLADTIDKIEDKYLGKDSYNPPRSFLKIRTERMYITNLESVFSVKDYTGVLILISSHHITFISRYGAIEIQHKMVEDKRGLIIPFDTRKDKILFQKNDAWEDGVWHEKNK